MIPYTLVRSSRKTVGIQITPEGEVILRCPRRLPEAAAVEFLERKRPWIERHLQALQSIPAQPPFPESELTSMAAAPPEVLDYIVVHELCHRKEMNHSPRFWSQVAQILPNYRAQEAWLKTEGRALIRRLPK